MSYTEHTWTTGETITADKMNNIEEGIVEASQSGSSALICTSSYSEVVGNYILDKTVQEIYDALLDGTPAYIKFQYGGFDSYEGSLYLAPIIKVYNYDQTNLIRIVASKPQFVGTVGGLGNSFSPAVLIYTASGLNEYPNYYTTVSTTTSSVTTSGIE